MKNGKRIAILLAALMLLCGCRLIKTALVETLPTEAPTPVPTDAPTPEPTPVPTEEPTPTPEPTQKPTELSDLVGMWTLTGAMRNTRVVDIRGKKIKAYFAFYEDHTGVHYWDSVQYIYRFNGFVAVKDDTLLFVESYGFITMTYDAATDTLLVKNDDPDAGITDYIYSRTPDAVIPEIVPPMIDSTAKNGLVGTWRLFHAEGKTRDAAAIAEMINQLFIADTTNILRYVFKETGSGFEYKRDESSETILYFTYTKNDRALRITGDELALFDSGTFDCVLDGDTLIITDGDLSFTFYRTSAALDL